MVTSAMTDSNGKPTRQRLNAERTRKAILDAARHVFATRGFAQAGIREIAKEAAANPALIGRYFGSKLNLFREALEAVVDAETFTSMDRSSFGEVLAGNMCETRPDSAAIVPMVVFSAGDDAARAVTVEVLKRRIIEPMSNWLAGSQAEDRAVQFLTLITGFYTYRLMLPMDQIKDEVSPAMRQWLARSLQQVIDGNG